MLDGGHVLRSEPLAALEVTGTVEVEVLDDPTPLIAHLQAAGAGVEHDGARLTVRSETGDPFLLVRDALAASGVGLRRLGTGTTSLEDIFLTEGGES
jgi:hypothetical protein